MKEIKIIVEAHIHAATLNMKAKVLYYIEVFVAKSNWGIMNLRFTILSFGFFPYLFRLFCMPQSVSLCTRSLHNETNNIMKEILKLINMNKKEKAGTHEYGIFFIIKITHTTW